MKPTGRMIISHSGCDCKSQKILLRERCFAQKEKNITPTQQCDRMLRCTRIAIVADTSIINIHVGPSDLDHWTLLVSVSHPHCGFYNSPLSYSDGVLVLALPHWIDLYNNRSDSGEFAICSNISIVLS